VGCRARVAAVDIERGFASAGFPRRSGTLIAKAGVAGLAACVFLPWSEAEGGGDLAIPASRASGVEGAHLGRARPLLDAAGFDGSLVGLPVGASDFPVGFDGPVGGGEVGVPYSSSPPSDDRAVAARASETLVEKNRPAPAAEATSEPTMRWKCISVAFSLRLSPKLVHIVRSARACSSRIASYSGMMRPKVSATFSAMP
jgi:hypothetical protein